MFAYQVTTKQRIGIHQTADNPRMRDIVSLTWSVSRDKNSPRYRAAAESLCTTMVRMIRLLLHGSGSASLYRGRLWLAAVLEENTKEKTKHFMTVCLVKAEFCSAFSSVISTKHNLVVPMNVLVLNSAACNRF